jgi:hypothetical protein
MFDSEEDLIKHYQSKGEEYDESIFESFSVSVPADRDRGEIMLVGHGCAFLNGWSISDSISTIFVDGCEKPIWDYSHHSQR